MQEEQMQGRAVDVLANRSGVPSGFGAQRSETGLVDAAADTLGHDVEQLEAAISELGMRLSPVLGMGNPQPELGPDTAMQPSQPESPHVERLQGISRRVRGLQAGVAEILSRLQT